MTNSAQNLSTSHLITISYQTGFTLNSLGGTFDVWGYNGQDRQLLDKVDILPLVS